MPFVVGAAFVWWTVHDPGVPLAPANRSAALAEVLRGRGLVAAEEDVTWVDPVEGGGHDALAIVRARAKDDPADLYLVSTRLSPEGFLLEVLGVHDLTRTSGVDEGRPLVQGPWIAYETSSGDTVTAVHTLDLRGSSVADYPDFTRLQRWQTAMTNLEQTGREAGVAHSAYALDPMAHQVELRWGEHAVLHVDADGREIAIDAARGTLVKGGGWVRPVPEEKARPGNLITWSVDRVRAMPWFGDTRMQWLKAVVFTGLDAVLRLRSRVVDTSERDVAADLGVTGASLGTTTEPDPGVDWPPPPLAPLLSPHLPGEGRWIVLDHDPFITPAPGLPPAFATTFVRTDRDRPDTRVYVTLWDPRQIALHMVAGTVEPVSASGEAGPGLIPRVPEVMERLVAGFNGGFQALHGEYGMQADGVPYLPPKPYAATILELRDGSTGFGAWPDSPDVPDEVLGFRQNLTAIVQDQKWNPWGRTWWGGTPPGWQDNIHTTRTAVCLTHDGSIGYFFGADLSAEALGRGMIQAHCDFGVHLDMNPGLAGFEFYDVERSEAWKPLPRPIQADWEYEGTIHDLPDLHVRARRMTRSMMEVNFPQYIHREARDFFYLTRRALLPGRDVAPAADLAGPGDGAWTTRGLPQHGFPYAVATTVVPLAADHRVHMLRIDPKTVRPAGSAGTTESTPTVASLFAPTSGPLVLSWQAGVFLLGTSVPAGGVRVAAGVSPGVANPGEVRAVAGVQDLDGMLDWIELPPGADGALVQTASGLLARLGCSQRIAFEGEAKAVLDGAHDLGGAPVSVPSSPFVRFVRASTPSARLFFPSTPVVGPAIWQPLQSRRVRYFPKPPKSPSSTPTSSASAPGDPTPHAPPPGAAGHT